LLSSTIFISLGLVLKLSSSHYFGDISIPKYFAVQRLKGGNPTSGLPIGMLVTRHRECKDNRTANLKRNCGKKRINRLTPNDSYMGRTAPLTSKRCILYIYSTNIGTEYFKHALYSPFFLFKMHFFS